MLKPFCVAFLLLLAFSCKKDNDPTPVHYRYYEVGLHGAGQEPGWKWQDTTFVVAVADTNTTLIAEINTQLQLPVAQRNKFVAGTLVAGDGGYNRNISHRFKWHFKEDDWNLVEVTIELTDGLPYTDVDVNNSYWMEKVKRFSPWVSYIKKEIEP